MLTFPRRSVLPCGSLFTLVGMLGLFAMSHVGCASMLNVAAFKSLENKETAANPVTQIVCLWQPAEGRDPEGIPCRGFAGQIMFITQRSAAPTKVDGEVRVYVFDDQGSDEEQVKPIRQFDFESKPWAMHLTNGTLGPTYSVFIPYTRRGMHEAQCALRIRYTPKNAPALYSDLSTVLLKGKKTPLQAQNAGPSEPVVSLNGTPASSLAQRTTTISLDPRQRPAAPASGTPSASDAQIAELKRQIEQLQNPLAAAPLDPALADGRIQRTQFHGPAAHVITDPNGFPMEAEGVQQVSYDTTGKGMRRSATTGSSPSTRVRVHPLAAPATNPLSPLPVTSPNPLAAPSDDADEPVPSNHPLADILGAGAAPQSLAPAGHATIDVEYIRPIP